MNEPGLNDQTMPGNTGREPSVAVSPGAQLAACRQERGWTIEQVASQLNLAPRQVVALEADDYPSLPGMAIVRGFVRQYAKLLKIDATPLLASLGGETVLAHEPVRPRQNLSTPFSEARLPSMNSRSGVSAKWIVAAVAVVVVGAVAYAVNQGVDFAGMSESASSQVKDSLSQITTPSAPGASDASAVPEPINAQPPVEPAAGNGMSPPEQSAAAGQASDGADQQQAMNPPPSGTQQGGTATSQAPAPSPGAATAAASAAGTAAAASPSTSAVAAAPPSTATPASPMTPATPTTSSAAPAANGGNTLVIKARQDSWIEIKPAGSGKPAIARVVKAGETETFEVTDPVAVVIGNASGVDATLRGNPVELKAPGNGNVARLTLK